MGTNEGQQDALFDVHGPDYEVGYRVPIACQSQVLYRRLDYWARTDLVKPPSPQRLRLRFQRLYSFRDILVLKIVGACSIPASPAEHPQGGQQAGELPAWDDLAGYTSFPMARPSTSAVPPRRSSTCSMVARVLFGIAVPGLMKELSGDITSFPSEKISTDPAIDELAERRRRRRLA